jgi:branched-chain amino acid transport system permease protein
VSLNRGLAAAAVILAVLAPLYMSHYWISAIFTQALFLGIGAASLIFLSAYGGMVSLGQTAIYGIAGIILANAVTNGQAKGLHLGWNPWLGLVLGITVATAVGLLIGLLASRSLGIYFLMLTLTFGVLTYTFFGSVTQFGGFSPVNGNPYFTPSIIGDPSGHANRLYYVALGVSLVTYVVIRYIVRTPFGLTLQGIRDDPVRMASLGYNVVLHRTIAFGFAAFVASFAGVLYVWWQSEIDAESINLDQIIALLVIAVIGGLFRIEGAWVGAFAYVVIQNEVTNWLNGGSVPVIGGTFYTVIGLIFLVIVLVSPGGLLGIWDMIGNLVTRKGSGPTANHGPAVPSASPAEGGT